MKRLILSILACLLLAAPALAFDGACQDGEPWQLARMNPAILGAAGPVYTDCSQIGTAQFYWNGEQPDSKDGCKTGGVKVDGTIAGELVTIEAPPTPSPSSGGNAMKIAATAGYTTSISFPISSGDIYSSSEGRICFNVYMAASTGTDYFVRFRNSVANDASVRIASTGVVTYDHLGNSVGTVVNSSDTVSDNAWTNICSRWSVSGNKISIKIGTGEWLDDSDADAVTAFTVEPTDIKFPGNTVVDILYIDDVFIWTSSGL